MKIKYMLLQPTEEGHREQNKTTPRLVHRHNVGGRLRHLVPQQWLVSIGSTFLDNKLACLMFGCTTKTDHQESDLPIKDLEAVIRLYVCNCHHEALYSCIKRTPPP
jgi:hypothetical protein